MTYGGTAGASVADLVLSTFVPVAIRRMGFIIFIE